MQLLLVLLVTTLVALGMLYANQRDMIYLPTRVAPPQFAALVRATFGSGATILAPFDAVVVESPADMPVRGTAIVFHGNASLGIDRTYMLPVFAARGLRLVLAEYPGYGSRAGAPTEQTLVDDGNALYDEVLRRYPGSPVILVGESIGTGVAVQVAIRRTQPPTRLVLLTPFLSLAETAARVYPFLPVRYLIKDRFDSARQLRRYQGPVALLIAGQDEVVGATQGRALADWCSCRRPNTRYPCLARTRCPARRRVSGR